MHRRSILVKLINSVHSEFYIPVHNNVLIDECMPQSPSPPCILHYGVSSMARETMYMHVATMVITTQIQTMKRWQSAYR